MDPSLLEVGALEAWILSADWTLSADWRFHFVNEVKSTNRKSDRRLDFEGQAAGAFPKPIRCVFAAWILKDGKWKGSPRRYNMFFFQLCFVLLMGKNAEYSGTMIRECLLRVGKVPFFIFDIVE